MQAIAKYFPLAFLALIVILVALFGNFREPVIILLHSAFVFDRNCCWYVADRV